MNKKLIFLIAGGLVLITAIIYFVFIHDYGQTPAVNDTNSQPTLNVDSTPAVTESPAPTAGSVSGTVSPETQGREQVTRLALSFAERYGSSSSQSDFSNLQDLEIFMTDAFKARTRTFIATEQAKAQPSSTYIGTTTKAVVAKVISYDATIGTAQITVSTKRQETKSGAAVKSYNQELKISLKRVGTEWLVDSAEWGK